MGKPCKGILIDPFTCTIAEVDHSGDLPSFYKLLTHESMPVNMIEAAYPSTLAKNDVLFVDEEGLLKPCERFIMYQGFHQPLAGKGLVFGTSSSGNTILPRTKIASVCENVKFLERIGSSFFQTVSPWTPDDSDD